MNVYQAREINEIRNVIFSFQLWDTFLSVKTEVGMFTKLISSFVDFSALITIGSYFITMALIVYSLVAYHDIE